MSRFDDPFLITFEILLFIEDLGKAIRLMTAQPARRKITQQDVARLAGVSVSTVSLVLGGKGRISQESVLRVYQAIDALGYQYCSTASSISSFPELIGIILPHHCTFSHDLLPALCQTLQSEGRCTILLYSEPTEGALLTASDRLIKQGACGLVLCGQSAQSAKLRLRAKAQGIPLISVTPHLGAEIIPAVRPDNTQAAQLAAEILLDKSHTSIAYLGGKSNSLTRAERLGGLSMALGKVGLAFNPTLSLSCEATFAAASLATSQLIKQQPRPTALLCDNPIVLKAAHHILNTGSHASKWRLFSRTPDLIGFGECPEAQTLGLMQISISPTELTRRAVTCLLAQFNGSTLLADDPRLVVASRPLAVR